MLILSKCRTIEQALACPCPKPIHPPLSLVTKAPSRLEVGDFLAEKLNAHKKHV
jgi:hypothetical protein